MFAVYALIWHVAATHRKAGTLAIVLLSFGVCALGPLAPLHAASNRTSQDTPVTLQEALQDGRVEASAQAIGLGFREPMVRLTVSSLGSDIVVIVPIGTRMSSGMAQFAEIVIGEEKQVRASPTADVDLTAYSLQPEKSLPSAMSEVQYLVAGIADEDVQQGLRTLQSSGAGSDYGGQLALWSWVTGKTLQQLIAMSSFPPEESVVARAAAYLGLTPTPADTAAGTVEETAHFSAPLQATPAAATIGAQADVPADAPSQPPGNTLQGQTSSEPTVASSLPYELILFIAALIVLVVAVLLIALNMTSKRNQQAITPSAQISHGPSRSPQSAEEKSPPSQAGPWDRAVLGGAAASSTGQPIGRSLQAESQQVTDDLTQSVELNESDANSEYGVELIGTDGPLTGERYAFNDRRILSRGPLQWIEMRAADVSVPHAAIDFAPNDSRIKDLRSRNGVFVGGRALQEGFSPLSTGAEVTIGSSTLRLGSANLQFVTGPMAGKSCSLSPQMWVVTRETLRVLQVSQDRRISDAHALLTPAVLGLNIRDLNSSNGSWIGAERVLDDTWATAGDELRFGSSCLRVEVKFGRYRLHRVIGEGGMARVYYATDLSNRGIALKTPRESEAPFRERFDRESSILRSLNHKHIVPIYEIGEMSGVPFVAMEYMRGGTLFEQLENGPLPLKYALLLAAQVADALEYAHGRGLICHRDVKPSNVLMDEKGNPYLTDFGIARRTDDRRITSFGAAVGTLAYMSPEQLNGSAVDRRTDIYSLGVVIYQMLSGEVPFEGTSKTVSDLKLHQAPPALRTVAPDVPETVEQVVMQCLQIDPERRYPTAGELAAAIRKASVN